MFFHCSIATWRPREFIGGGKSKTEAYLTLGGWEEGGSEECGGVVDGVEGLTVAVEGDGGEHFFSRLLLLLLLFDAAFVVG